METDNVREQWDHRDGGNLNQIAAFGHHGQHKDKPSDQSANGNNKGSMPRRRMLWLPVQTERSIATVHESRMHIAFGGAWSDSCRL
jgi:hypothetical protein